MMKMIREKFPQYADMPDEDLMAAIHAKHYSDMSREEFDRCCNGNRPEHDDLAAAAVTGRDSFDLQNLAPQVKPAVKMTAEQFIPIFQQGIPGKVAVIMEDGTTYIIDYTATDPVEAMESIMQGDDSELLGYPAKGDSDAAVTKQGEVVTDLGMMKQHAGSGNVAWAASGERGELMRKAETVANAVKTRQQIQRG